jgi:hypothetical protein
MSRNLRWREEKHKVFLECAQYQTNGYADDGNAADD